MDEEVAVQEALVLIDDLCLALSSPDRPELVIAFRQLTELDSLTKLLRRCQLFLP